MFKINSIKEEEKHKRTLSHFLEKFHQATGYQNKDVAEKLGLDKGTYSKIRQQQISPLTNSIITLKRFSSLNNLSIIDFIAKIEEIAPEIHTNDWSETLNTIMIELGPILRSVLIHNRLSIMIDKDPNYAEKLRKCFLLLALLIDLLKHEKWFDYCYDTILKIHENIGIEKNKNLESLIARINIKKKENR